VPNAQVRQGCHGAPSGNRRKFFDVAEGARRHVSCFRIRMRSLCVGFFSLVPFFLNGCAGCTEEGCSDAVEIGFTGMEGLEAGDYEFEVVTEQGSGVCRVTLEEGGQLAGSGAEGGAGGVPNSSYPSCEGAVWLDFPGSTLVGMTVNYDADQLLVTISINGTQLLQENLAPDYKESYPNGERCDTNPCRNATETIAL
jgi:hypothetical protein